MLNIKNKILLSAALITTVVMIVQFTKRKRVSKIKFRPPY
jgi:hypothetical protein